MLGKKKAASSPYDYIWGIGGNEKTGMLYHNGSSQSNELQVTREVSYVRRPGAVCLHGS